MSSEPFGDALGDAPALVVVLNNLDDLVRAQTQRWYRIPFARAPRRIGADFLAFYQTAAFPQGERWSVRWVASVQGYRIATRRELIPEEPDHPRADARYHRIALGELTLLPHPIPSRRLRRITFIQTTIQSLCEATEINQLWRRTPGQERMWQALQQAGLADETEHEYPLIDDSIYTADFAVFADGRRIAVMLMDDSQELGDCVRERAALDYPLARGGWHGLFVDPSNRLAIDQCLADIRRICKNTKQGTS